MVQVRLKPGKYQHMNRAWQWMTEQFFLAIDFG